MSCFTCDNCLSLDDLAKCDGAFEMDPAWVNAEGEDKTYVLVWDFNGRAFRHEFTILDTDPVLIPRKFQKDSVIEFYVLDFADARMTKTVDAVEYDCFRIKVGSVIDV